MVIYIHASSTLIIPHFIHFIRFIHVFIYVYASWSSLNCAQSCNDCDGSRSAANVKRKAYLREDDGSGCFDLHEDCFERAIDGGCKSFEGHMFKGCRRSCKHCKPNAPDAEVEELHSGIVTQSPVSASATDEGEDNEDDDEDTCYDKLPHCKDIVRVEGCEKNKA